MLVPNICGSSVWNLFHITLLAPSIMRWLLEFWKKLCTPVVLIREICLCYTAFDMVHQKYQSAGLISLSSFGSFQFVVSVRCWSSLASSASPIHFQNIQNVTFCSAAAHVQASHTSRSPYYFSLCIMEDAVNQCATQPNSFIQQKKALWLHEASPNILEVMLLA